MRLSRRQTWVVPATPTPGLPPCSRASHRTLKTLPPWSMLSWMMSFISRTVTARMKCRPGCCLRPVPPVVVPSACVFAHVIAFTRSNMFHVCWNVCLSQATVCTHVLRVCLLAFTSAHAIFNSGLGSTIPACLAVFCLVLLVCQYMP